MTALALLWGMGIGLGVVLVVTGLWGRDRRQVPSTLSPERRRAWAQRLALGAGLALVVGLLTRWPVAAVGAGVFGVTAPYLFGGHRANKVLIERTEAIAAWTEMLRDTLVSVGGLEEAITATADVAPAPIRAEVIALADRLQATHTPLVVALREFADALADPTADLVAAALLLAAQRPPRTLPATLRALSMSARDDASMRLRVETGRARTRTTVRIVLGVVVGFTVVLVIFMRSYLQPFSSSWGQVALLAAVACFGGALWWLASMAHPRRPARFLTGLPRNIAAEDL